MKRKYKINLIFLILFNLLIIPNILAVDISNCSNLNITGTIYYLTQNITNSNYFYCLNITASNITLDCRGYTIDFNSSLGGGTTRTGININRASDVYTNITIKNCILSDWVYGLYLYRAHNNYIENWNTTRNSKGIEFNYANFNTVKNFNGIANDMALSFSNSNNNTIINGNVSDCTQNPHGAITIGGNSQYNKFINIFFLNNMVHSFKTMTGAYNNYLINCTFLWNMYGNTPVYLELGSGSTNIEGCTFRNSCLDFVSSGNVVKDSKFINSCFNLHRENNKIYNNIFNGTSPNFFASGGNYNAWNITKQLGTRIYSDGKYIGGNYYTNSVKTGYSDTCLDLDRNGFCDTPNTHTFNNIDYLTLSDEFWEGCGDAICSEELEETQKTCCIDCGCPPNKECIENECWGLAGYTLKDIGYGIGNLFLNMVNALLIFLILLALGTSIGILLARVGRSLGEKI